VTAVPTLIECGRPERLEVRLANGTLHTLSLAELPQLVTQQQNPDNRKQVALVRAVLETGLPHPHMVLVDSPGVGSVFEHNTEATEAALEAMDVAVLVLTADAPMSQSEASLLARVAELSVRVVVVLNKADLLSERELVEARDFVVASASTVLGASPTAVTCSARRGLAAAVDHDDEGRRLSGVMDLQQVLAGHLDEGRHRFLRASVSAAAQRIIARRRDEAAVTLAAIRAVRADRDEQVGAFAEAVAEAQQREGELLAQLDSTSRALRTALQTSMLDRLPVSTEAVRAHLDPDGVRRPAAGPTETERLASIGEAVVLEVEEWLRSQDAVIDATFESHRRRAQRALEQTAVALKDRAQELLGVSLRTAVATLEVAPPPVLRYDLQPEAVWDQAMYSFWRRHGPGAGRRAARYLQEQAGGLTDKHLGRAREVLQERLTLRARLLREAVAAAFDEEIGGLTRAYESVLRLKLDAAADLAQEEMQAARTVEQLSLLQEHLSSKVEALP
jgi:hypothetical protein